MVLETMTHWVTYTFADTDVMLKTARNQLVHREGGVEQRLSGVPIMTEIEECINVPLGEDVYTYILDCLRRKHTERTIIEVTEIDRIPVEEGAGQIFF